MIPIQKLDDVSLKKRRTYEGCETAFTMSSTREWKCKSIYTLPDQERFLSDTYWTPVPDMGGLSLSKGTFLSSQGQSIIHYLCKFQTWKCGKASRAAPHPYKPALNVGKLANVVKLSDISNSPANIAELKAQHASYHQEEEFLIQNVPTCWNSTLETMSVQNNKEQLQIKLVQQEMNTTVCQSWKRCWSHAGEEISLFLSNFISWQIAFQ